MLCQVPFLFWLSVGERAPTGHVELLRRPHTIRHASHSDDTAVTFNDINCLCVTNSRQHGGREVRTERHALPAASQAVEKLLLHPAFARPSHR